MRKSKDNHDQRGYALSDNPRFSGTLDDLVATHVWLVVDAEHFTILAEARKKGRTLKTLIKWLEERQQNQ